MWESLFAARECDMLDGRRFKAQVEARMAVFEFIEGWYNPHRRHSALDYLSPINYERIQQTESLTASPTPSMETWQLHIRYIRHYNPAPKPTKWTYRDPSHPLSVITISYLTDHRAVAGSFGR